MKNRVLIIDDSVFMRKIIANILVKNGYKIVGEASNGREGFQKFKDLKPDIAILDITMPDVDGITCLKSIKSIFPDACIVMCSAMGQKPLIVESIKSGAKDFITKPFDNNLIINTIKNALHN